MIESVRRIDSDVFWSSARVPADPIGSLARARARRGLGAPTLEVLREILGWLRAAEKG